MIKLVLSGIKSQLWDYSSQKIPLSPQQMVSIYNTLDLSDAEVHMKCCALMLSFRSLLRKSNIVPDKVSETRHTILRKDVVFDDAG